MEEWDALNCPRHDLDYLIKRTEQTAEISSYLQEGANKLHDSGLDQFLATLPAIAEICRQLKGYGIPDMLIHRDFRDDNLVWQDGKHRIIDWADVVIGHPFLSLDRLFTHRVRVSVPEKQGGGSSFSPISKENLQSINAAYLQAFLPFASMERLQEAMSLSRKLFPFWKFCGIRHELNWVEKDSQDYMKLVVQLQNSAKRMISASSGQGA